MKCKLLINFKVLSGGLLIALAVTSSACSKSDPSLTKSDNGESEVSQPDFKTYIAINAFEESLLQRSYTSIIFLADKGVRKSVMVAAQEVYGFSGIPLQYEINPEDSGIPLEPETFATYIGGKKSIPNIGKVSLMGISTENS